MTTEELIIKATKYIDSRFKQEFFSYWDMLYSIVDVVRPREKRIAELEITNKKISDECHKLVDTLEKKQKEIAELEKEKEKAELKEYNKYLKRKRQGGIQKQYNKVAIIKQRNEQLTEAKALLTRFVMVSIYLNGKEQDLVKEAEQFLKENR